MNEDRFRRLFMETPVGIAVLDARARIVECNPALLDLFEIEGNIPGKIDSRKVIHQEDLPRLRGLFRKLARGEQSHFQTECRYCGDSNVPRWMRLTVSPFEEKGGPPGFTVALVEDITSKKLTEERLNQSRAETKRLSSRLVEAQETECLRIAQELHDGISSKLAAVKFLLEDAPDGAERPADPAGHCVERARTMIGDVLDELRGLSTRLRPPILDDLGLVTTIRWLAREFQEIHPNIDFELELTAPEERIPERYKIVIYRIAQEALNNVAKHSGAGRVRLALFESRGGLELIIEDDGRGFDTKATFPEEEPKSFGLESMKDRAEFMDGTLDVESRLEEGTRVRARWPIHPEPWDGRAP